MNNLVAGDIMTARIKELETELAELKAKNIEIIEAAKLALGDMQGLLDDQLMDFRTGCPKYDGQCADDLSRLVYQPLTQAKEQSE
tara:strand:+ start:292 stop:546 length:255 start_codon:yes stop_codon:yes gene_type:complete